MPLSFFWGDFFFSCKTKGGAFLSPFDVFALCCLLLICFLVSKSEFLVYSGGHRFGRVPLLGEEGENPNFLKVTDS
jgi:hypothetical protein